MTNRWKNDDEYIELVKDLLVLEEVKALEDFTYHIYSNRLEHSLSVSYRSFRWAKRFNLDHKAIARAGLLHDLFYYYPKDYQVIPNGKGHLRDHPSIACSNAEKIVQLNDLEKDIILKHMFGFTLAVPDYPESLIVSLVDKQCAILEFIIPTAKIVRDKVRFRNVTTS